MAAGVTTIGWEEEERPAAGRGQAPAQPLPGRSEIPSSNKKPSARPARDSKARPAAEEGQGPPGQEIELRKQQPEKPKWGVRWRCSTGCGACCKLDKGPEFLTPDKDKADGADHLQLAVQEHDWPRWIVHQLRQVQPNLQHLRRLAILLLGRTEGFRRVLWCAMQQIRQGSLQVCWLLLCCSCITSRWCMVRTLLSLETSSGS